MIMLWFAWAKSRKISVPSKVTRWRTVSGEMVRVFNVSKVRSQNQR
jgi:hypothetical protein